MYTIILVGGRQLDALILSVSPDRLRVVTPGRADTLEFRAVDGKWVSESGAQVELGALISAGAAETARVMGVRNDALRLAV
ncbi:MAG: hypothetical protein ABI759_11560 [Candidatus Solibacter sp.]